MKLILTLLLFVCLPQAEQRILWHESRKLQWSDFRGTPESNSPFAAITNTGVEFGYSYTMNNGEIEVTFTVSSFFNPSESWYFPHLADDHILRHEQAHFDISELHARILRKRLSEKRFTKNIKNEIHTIYNKVEQQRKSMQRRFDAETDHSQNVKKEAFWEAYIAKQLMLYDKWKQ